ncbi:MAG: 2-polyprenylphenol 6-hydroxylase, partial [Alphaproteobacteria bacterium]
LLLLQKSMLLAEGVGRRLAPDINMWQVAQPLIEEWMAEHAGPEARLREFVTETADTLARLPIVIAEVERAAHKIADAGNPTFGGARQPARWPYWAAIALVAALFLLLL